MTSRTNVLAGGNRDGLQTTLILRTNREDMVTSGNRFIERQYYKVRDWIRTGVLESRYINTRVNCSDLMTKAVSVETSEELGGMLAGKIELPPVPERADAVQRF